MRTPDQKKIAAEAAVIFVWHALELIEKARTQIKDTVSYFDPEKPENALHRDCAAFHAYVQELGLGEWISAESRAPWKGGL